MIRHQHNRKIDHYFEYERKQREDQIERECYVRNINREQLFQEWDKSARKYAVIALVSLVASAAFAYFVLKQANNYQWEDHRLAESNLVFKVEK